jgi:hypothetical protein
MERAMHLTVATPVWSMRELRAEETPRRAHASAADLVRDAIDEARELVRLEVALAKDEARTELYETRAGAIALGVTATLAILGLAMLLVALVLAIQVGWAAPLICGVILLACAALGAYVAWKVFPKKPLDETRRRLSADVSELRSRTEALAPHTKEGLQ